MTRTRVLRTAEESSVQSRNDDWSDKQREAARRSIYKRARRVTWDGRTLTVAEWSEATDLPHYVITSRLYNGWAVEAALTTPVRGRAFTEPVRTPAQQRRAGKLLGQAVRAGIIKRPDACEDCGAPGPLHGHHQHGYADHFALIVDWLCPRCHRCRHVAMRGGSCKGNEEGAA